MIPSPFLLLPCLQLSAPRQSWDLVESRQDNYPSFGGRKIRFHRAGVVWGCFFFLFFLFTFVLFSLLFLPYFLPFLTLPFPIFFPISLFFFPFFSWLGTCDVTWGIPWSSGCWCELTEMFGSSPWLSPGSSLPAHPGHVEMEHGAELGWVPGRGLEGTFKTSEMPLKSLFYIYSCTLSAGLAMIIKIPKPCSAHPSPFFSSFSPDLPWDDFSSVQRNAAAQ